jgi:hypothetical protein
MDVDHLRGERRRGHVGALCAGGLSSWLAFVFGLAGFGASTYGWLAGPWPCGVIEGLWSVPALRRWQRVWASNGAIFDEKRRQERASEIKSPPRTSS